MLIKFYLTDILNPSIRNVTKITSPRNETMSKCLSKTVPQCMLYNNFRESCVVLLSLSLMRDDDLMRQPRDR